MDRVKAGIIFVLTLITFVSYTPQDIHNPQQITRLALTLAITEGKLDIEDYADRTVDKSELDGRIYADKPPGLSLLAVPAVWLARNALGVPTGVLSDAQFSLVLSAAVVSTVGLLAAFASALLYLLCRRLGVSDAAALFASCGLAVATPFLGWSTAFFTHSATGSLLLIALAMAVWFRKVEPVWPAFLVGLLFGLLLTIDLTAAPAVAIVGLFYLSGRWPLCLPRLVAAGLGGLVGLAPLLIYNDLAFGSPLTLGYSRVVGFEGMKTGLFGLTAPDPIVMARLLVGMHRGLLPLSPLLLLIPIGWVQMMRKPKQRALGLAVMAIGLSFLLINSSYHYWTGGASTGPRHLIGMLPVIAIALAFAWPKGRTEQGISLALLVLSALISAACAGVYMFADSGFARPLIEPIGNMVLFEGRWPRLLNIVVPLAGFALLARMGQAKEGSSGSQVAARLAS